jgi:hexosaminidase
MILGAILGAIALSIVPQPRSVTAYPTTYNVPASLTIRAASADERNVAQFAQTFLRDRGITAAVEANAPSAQLQLNANAHDPSLGTEGYRLHVGSDGIAIYANAGAGLFYGLQTLEQLFPATGGSNAIHEAEISDSPTYRWRGIHLDVSRHFFDVPTVEKYIDVAAHYKLNTFHWHLTDDQGWRIQIKRYPKLTEVGGCRAGTMIDKDFTSSDRKRYCGYYTQDQIRQVIAYAKKRYVTIVPEIEMPGHSTAAVAAYPQLTCNPHPGIKTLEIWGVSDDIFCPTPYTFKFLENVLSEVIDLFPATYIHIGGDEVPKASWRKSAYVHQLMKREHLANYDQVQGYFTRTIEKYIISKGRRMVGWDEILDGGVTQTATIMSWRGVDGGIAAAKHGNDVVMSPDPPLYLDHYQGDPDVEPLAIGGYTTLEHLYNYDPMPPDLTPAEQQHILGAQGNLWTEYIPTPDRLFYRLLPRELALAEFTWTPASEKSWPSFEARLAPQYAWLAAQHYNFHVPNPSVHLSGAEDLQFAALQPNLRATDVITSSASPAISLTDDAANAAIYYTTNGSAPNAKSARYQGPIAIDLKPGQRLELQAIAVLPDGRSSFATEFVIYRSQSQQSP